MDHTQQHAKHYRVNGAPARTMIEHAKETQPVAAEPASAEPVEISLPVFAPYQSNAAETEVMKPVHVAPVKTVPAQMAPAQAQPVTRSVAQAVSQPSPVSVMSEQPVTASHHRLLSLRLRRLNLHHLSPWLCRMCLISM